MSESLFFDLHVHLKLFPSLTLFSLIYSYQAFLFSQIILFLSQFFFLVDYAYNIQLP